MTFYHLGKMNSRLPHRRRMEKKGFKLLPSEKFPTALGQVQWRTDDLTLFILKRHEMYLEKPTVHHVDEQILV